jgi:hypothetical protein
VLRDFTKIPRAPVRLSAHEVRERNLRVARLHFVSLSFSLFFWGMGVFFCRGALFSARLFTPIFFCGEPRVLPMNETSPQRRIQSLF